MHRFSKTQSLAIFLVGLQALFHAHYSHADEQAILAVVVSSNTEIAAVKTLASNELGLIYWRKKQYWQGGVRMRPVNLHAEHALRIQFSKIVLGSLPASQTDYWNGLYYHGVSPPYSLQSEEAVIRFVTDTKGAIGYVDACKVDARVKPLLWLTDGVVTAQKPSYDCVANELN